MVAELVNQDGAVLVATGVHVTVGFRFVVSITAGEAGDLAGDASAKGVNGVKAYGVVTGLGKVGRWL